MNEISDFEMPEEGREPFAWGRALAGLGGATGLILGTMDAGWMGAIAGALTGWIAGLMVGWAIRLVVSTFRPAGPQSRPCCAYSRVGRFVGRAFARVVGLGVLAAIAFELRWGINLVCLRCIHDTGEAIAQSTERGDARDYLRATLRDRQWQNRVFQARPLCWALTDDVAQMNGATLELIDLLNGKRISPDLERDWKKELAVRLRIMLLQAENPLLAPLTNPVLHQLGNNLCQATKERMSHCIEEATLTRFRKQWLPSTLE